MVITTGVSVMIFSQRLLGGAGVSVGGFSGALPVGMAKSFRWRGTASETPA
jgi:hypothetical protein